MIMVRVINEKEFANMVKSNTELNSTKPLVVDCYTDWCPPCKASAPLYEELSRKYEGLADFVKINVDHNQGVAMKLNVRNVPTFVILLGNRVKKRIIGADMRKLEKSIIEEIKAER